jgi:hypothetical protein
MLQIDREISGAFRLDQAVLHNTAEILQREPLRLKTPGQPWAYSAAFELQREALASRHDGGSFVVELDLEVEQGEIGVGGLTEDLQEFLGPETSVSAAAGRTLTRVVISDAARFSWLMIRNGSSAGRPAVLRLHAVHGYTARGGPSPDLFEVPRSRFENLLITGSNASRLIISHDHRSAESRPEPAGTSEVLPRKQKVE